jgi:hypothetical protein
MLPFGLMEILPRQNWTAVRIIPAELKWRR